MPIQEADEILSILASDARTPVERLARMTGKSVEDVTKAVTEYEKSGVIKHYKTVVDWERAGIEKVFAFIDVRVTPARDVGFDMVATRIAKFPQVQSVWLISGAADLRIVVEANSLRELASFVAEKLATMDGVAGTNTNFLLRRYKEDHDMYVDSDEDNRLVVAP
jgi:DNA-binding Lrp family transcriptional regulator